MARIGRLRDVSFIIGVIVLAVLFAGCTSGTPTPFPSRYPPAMPPLSSGVPTPTSTVSVGSVGHSETSYPRPPSATPAVTHTPPPSPTDRPTVTAFPFPPASPTPYHTPTPLAAGQIQGVWHRYTTAEGLCTNSPVLLGTDYIGSQDNLVCYPGPAGGQPPGLPDEWDSVTLPTGTFAVGAGRFVGGGLQIALNQGVCTKSDWETPMQCQTTAEGFPYSNMRKMVPYPSAAIYILPTRVVDTEGTDRIYDIPSMTGLPGVTVTDIAASPVVPDEEIWVGTDGFGVIVITRGSGQVARYTKADGLPGDSIRAITTGGEQRSFPARRDVWVATDEGLARWDGSAWTAYTKADGLPSLPIVGVSSAQYGTVWLALEGGAAYFDGRAWQLFIEGKDMPEGRLTGVMAAQGVVWFSTDGGGLLVFEVRSPQQ